MSCHEDHCNNNSSGGGVFLVLCIAFLLVAFLSIVVLAPGIALTAVINEIVTMEIGPLWGTTFICTIAIYGYFYWNQGLNEANRIYAMISIAVFVVLGILTLYMPDNIFYSTVQSMYPILFEKGNV